MDRALLQFLAVAEEGGITAAAERLNVTQPTVTVAIRKLEREHGVRLFERSSRGMVLTEFGTILFDHAQAMARLADHARTEIAARRAGQMEAIRIGCGFAWWELFVRDVVEAIQESAPRAPIHIEIANSFDGLNALLAGDVTVFVGHRVAQLSPSAGVRFEHLFMAQDGYFVRRGHPLLGRPIAFAALAQCDVADTVPVESRHRQLFHRFGAERPTEAETRRVLSCTSLTACLDLLRSSDAVLTYPAALEDYFAARDIARLPVTDPAVTEPVGLHTLSARRNHAATGDLCARLSVAAAECAELKHTAVFPDRDPDLSVDGEP